MEATKQEMTKKNMGAISADVSSMFEDMDYSSTEAKDLLIPKVLLLQGSSDRVKIDATHKAGDLIKSTTGEVYGSVREKDAQPIRFVPVYMFKTWVKKEVLGKGKLQYIETTPVTPENTDQRWEQEEVVDGVKHVYKLTKNINFYVVLEKDFGNPLAVPHVLTYRSTSKKAGAILENWFSECNIAQKAKIKTDANGVLMLPFAKVFELSGKLESDDENTWFVLKTTEVESLKAEDVRLGQLFGWYKTVSKYNHVKDVDNSEDTAAAAAAAAPEKQETRF
jgi:hypothetical protein